MNKKTFALFSLLTLEGCMMNSSSDGFGEPLTMPRSYKPDYFVSKTDNCREDNPNGWPYLPLFVEGRWCGEVIIPRDYALWHVGAKEIKLKDLKRDETVLSIEHIPDGFRALTNKGTHYFKSSQ